VTPYRHEATIPLGLVSGVFARPPLVFVVGPDRESRRLHVFTYRETPNGVEFVASRIIERPNGAASSPFFVSDITASGEFLAIHDVSDPLLASESSVRVFESTAGVFKPVKTASLPWATLFLSEEMRRRVNSRARLIAAPARSASSAR
jgi:hypothetical protein